MTDTVPFLAAHRATYVQVKHHCIVLPLEGKERIDLLVDHEGRPLVVGHSDDVLPLLQAQFYCDLLEDTGDIRIASTVVLRILPSRLSQQSHLLLGLP